MLNLFVLPSLAARAGTAVAALLASRSRCQWEDYHPERRGQFRVIAAAGAPEEVRPLGRVQICSVHEDDAVTVVVVRVGDSQGNPVQVQAGSWFGWNIPIAFPDELVEDNVVRLASWRGMPVYPNGTGIPLPPAHNHHALHMKTTPDDAWLANEWSSYHAVDAANIVVGLADYYCTEDMGGEDCVFIHAPPGTSLEVRHAGTILTVVINDMRPKEDKSAYPMFFEAAYRIYRPGPQSNFAELRTANFLKVSQPFAPGPQPGSSYPINSTQFFTFLVPPVHRGAPKDHMHFFQWQWPSCSGLVYDDSLHTHESNSGQDTFVFAGDLRSILDEMGYGKADGPVAQILHSTLGNVTARLKHKVQQGELRLICQWSHQAERLPVIRGAQPTSWDRRSKRVAGECVNGPHRIHANEQLATICFPHANENAGQAGATPAHMHCHWMFQFVADGPTQCR